MRSNILSHFSFELKYVAFAKSNYIFEWFFESISVIDTRVLAKLIIIPNHFFVVVKLPIDVFDDGKNKCRIYIDFFSNSNRMPNSIYRQITHFFCDSFCPKCVLCVYRIVDYYVKYWNKCAKPNYRMQVMVG